MNNVTKELIFFHKGLGWDTLSALQQPGYLKTCKNLSLEIEGKQTLRPAMIDINTTAVGSINSIKSWRGMLVVTDGNNIRANNGAGDFTNLYGSFSNIPSYFRSYKNFLAGCNGVNFFLIDTNKNLYPAQVDNPATAPVLADATSGSGPSGAYCGYVTFFITWPNGHTYETGLSPASNSLTLTDNTITWSNIPVSTYAKYYGTAPTIYRKLYRGPGTGGTLGDIYYVATISDNSSTTYSDSYTDVQLGANDACYVDDYTHPPIPKYIEWHYGRLFAIDSANTHRLYYSEPVAGSTASENELLMPIAILEDNWDDIRVSGFDHVDPQGLFSWGVNLYIPLKNTWVRKQGNDSDETWSYKKTYAKHGIGAPYTVDLCENPGGLIGVTNPEGSEPGIAIFGGANSNIIGNARLDYIFNHHMNLSAIANCRGKIIGRNYHLLYPSTGHTQPDTHLCIDLRRYPDIRVSEWTDLNGISIDSDSQGSQFYLGCNGIAKASSKDYSSNVELETHDLIGGDPKVFNEQKAWSELKYSLKGTVTLTVTVDGTVLKWLDNSTSQTLTGTNDNIQILKFPPNTIGYKISLKLTGTNLSELEIYSPWQLLFGV